VVPDTRSDVLQACVHLVGTRNRTSLQHGDRPQGSIGLEVPFDGPVDRALPVGVRGAENFIEHMEVDAVALHIVFDGSQPEVDEVHLLTVDQDVVGGKVAVRHGPPVELADFCTDAAKEAFHAFLRGRWVVEHLNQGSTGDMPNDQSAGGQIHVENRGNGHPVLSQTDEQPCFADHPSNAQPVIEVWVAPSTCPPLFAHGRPAKPLAGPHLGFSPQMQALFGDEDHELPTFPWFSNFTAHPFIEKGSACGQVCMTVSLPMCSVDFMDTALSPEEQAIADRISELKATLGDQLLILGHHYQRDSIVMHADFLGDSFMLSQKAAASSAKYIVFCGVHFMAESADILTSDEQAVMLPNLRAGCSMADMATLAEVEVAWEDILAGSGLADPIARDDPSAPAGEGEAFLVPVTYMNSSADLKDFVGRHGGVVCTSSNAEGVLTWAFERAGPNGAVLFFPDQHLGRNTGLAMGIDEARMPTWTPGQGASCELEGARIVLWHGFCSVHKRFTPGQIEAFRAAHPEGSVVVHPECPKETVQLADAYGSTQYIRRYVNDLPSGAQVAIGTEINMVARLAEEHPDKHIECLDEEICPCSTMYMIHPAYLMDVLERLVDGEVPNRIVVPDAVQHGAKLALNRMLAIPR